VNLRRLVLLEVVLIHNSTPAIITALSAIDIIILEAVRLTTISSRALKVDILLAQAAVGIAVFIDGRSIVAAILIEVSGGLELVLDLVGAIVKTSHKNSLGVLNGTGLNAQRSGQKGYECDSVHDCCC
jgi:hypothetical protein